MKEYFQLLCDLVRIPSFSREEKEAADFLQGWMTGHGMDVHRTANNLWVESEPASSKPTVLLNAHIDTVRPASSYTRDPFTPTIEGDRLYGLGTNDDGASLISLLSAFTILSSREQPYRLIFSATAEEEVTGADGIELIFQEIGPVSLGIIGEPTGMQMAVAEKGLMVLDCTANGITGHAAREEGLNALYKAIDDISILRSFRFEKVSEHLGPVKMSVTMIQAGTQHNVVPDKCSFVVDVRPNGEYSNQEILDIIKSIVSCDVTPRSLRHNSSSISSGHPVVRRGFELGLEPFGSPTTSNQTRCTDFPTLKIGPGDSARSHSADEFIFLSETVRAVSIYEKLLDGLEL